MAVVVIDRINTKSGGVKTTATFVLPITGDAFVTFGNETPFLVDETTMDVNITGVDADIQISLLQSNNSYETKAQPIEDANEVPIVEVLNNIDDFFIVNKFKGLVGFASIDELTATVGTIILTINSNSSL